MRNKKGQSESSSIGGIVAAVIAVVVLAIVIMALYSFFSGSGTNILRWLPSFNDTKPRVTNLEILSYNLKEDKVQFYDGSNWVDFKNQASVKLNDKTVQYSASYNTFFDYYYGRRDSSKDYSATFNEKYPGLVRQFVPIQDQMDHYGVDLNNKGYYIAGDNFSPTPLGQFTGGDSIKPDLIAWRDSIVYEPVSITYNQNGQDKTDKFCIDKEKFRVDRKIVIYLDKPFSGDKCQ